MYSVEILFPALFAAIIDSAAKADCRCDTSCMEGIIWEITPFPKMARELNKATGLEDKNSTKGVNPFDTNWITVWDKSLKEAAYLS